MERRTKGPLSIATTMVTMDDEENKTTKSRCTINEKRGEDFFDYESRTLHPDYPPAKDR